MNEYIFLRYEGYTFQSDMGGGMIKIKNLQVIGFAKGTDSNEAFLDLVSENPHLKETGFQEIFCYQLSQKYEQRRKDYNLHRQ